jgi:hypothetical protein
VSTQSNPIESHLIETDDLAFSAYLRTKGYRLVKMDSLRSKIFFFFELPEKTVSEEKIAFIHSDSLKFYNEIRNLKKLLLDQGG